MKKHILIIDDAAGDPRPAGAIPQYQGYRVTPVATAAEAFKIVQQDPPQLIISDLQLEDADGLEMIAELKTALPDTPVILLTGMLFDPQVVRDVLNKKSCRLPREHLLAHPHPGRSKTPGRLTGDLLRPKRAGRSECKAPAFFATKRHDRNLTADPADSGPFRVILYY